MDLEKLKELVVQLGIVGFKRSSSRITLDTGTTTSIPKWIGTTLFKEIKSGRFNNSFPMEFLQEVHSMEMGRIPELIENITKALYQWEDDKEAAKYEDGMPYFVDRDRFHIIRNMAQKEEYIVYDKKLEITRSDMSGDAFLDYNNDTDNPVPIDAMFAEYNPYRKDRLYHKKDRADSLIPCINLYNKPFWTTLTYKQASKSMFLEFFTHLVPDEKERKVVAGWVRSAMLYRCETYLVFNGPKGAGKNIFFDTVIAALVGHENYKKAGEGFLTKEFTSIMDRNRFILIDEFDVSNAKLVAKLKLLINRTVSNEKKGKDEETIENFNSFAISSNNFSDLHIESDDRRFNVITINQEPQSLKNAFGYDAISKFVNMLTPGHEDYSEEEVAFIGNWFIDQGNEDPYRDPNYLYRGDQFWTMVRNNLYVWQRKLIEHLYACYKEYLEEPDEFTKESLLNWKAIQKNVFKGINKRSCPQDWPKVLDFLRNHTSPDGSTPAKVIIVDGEKHLVPDGDYMEWWGSVETYERLVGDDEDKINKDIVNMIKPVKKVEEESIEEDYLSITPP